MIKVLASVANARRQAGKFAVLLSGKSGSAQADAFLMLTLMQSRVQREIPAAQILVDSQRRWYQAGAPQGMALASGEKPWA